MDDLNIDLNDSKFDIARKEFEISLEKKRLHLTKKSPKICDLKNKLHEIAAEEENNWVQPIEWDNSMKRNNQCEVCFKAVKKQLEYNSCLYCNIVTHVYCLDPTQRDLANKRQWVCSDCL